MSVMSLWPTAGHPTLAFFMPTIFCMGAPCVANSELCRMWTSRSSAYDCTQEGGRGRASVRQRRKQVTPSADQNTPCSCLVVAVEAEPGVSQHNVAEPEAGPAAWRRQQRRVVVGAAHK